MKTVVLTDGKYRSAIAAARALGRAGYRVLVTQTRAESPSAPPVFSSVYAEGRWLEGSVQDSEYPARLLALLEAEERPVLLPVGAASQYVISCHSETFAQAADFLIAPPEALDGLNDKAQVHARALALGLPVPEEFSGPPERYPVVIKPHCGEKLGLKAKERYAIAGSPAEFAVQYEKMRRLDPAPLVQEKVEGDGRGVSLLLGSDGALLSAICHRRIREYPASGGPSTCCITEYDPAAIEIAHRLLMDFGFRGLAMVEFKGDKILEVNPRIWGTFPLTVFAGAHFCENYARAAAGEAVAYTPRDYRVGVKMRFGPNDLAASADLLRHGRLREGLAGLRDLFTVREALSDPTDRAAYRSYLLSYLRR